jgi:hypothetical protein
MPTMAMMRAGAIGTLVAASAIGALGQEARMSAPFNPRAPLGLPTFQDAITSAGFHCPVVETVRTDLLSDARSSKFVHRVQCRDLGSLVADPKLTYHVQQAGSEPRFEVRRW